MKIATSARLLSAALLALPACADPVVASDYLAILNISPPHGAVNIGLDVQVMATFSAPLDETTVNESTTWLEDDQEDVVPGSVTWDPDSYTIALVPDADLAPTATFTAVFTTALASGETGPLLAEVRSAFTTTNGGGDDNAAPLAEAGEDQEVLVGDLVTLDGTGSTDPEGAALTFAWTLEAAPSGSLAALDAPAAALPAFEADLPGTYVASLVVRDGSRASDPDYVTVTASE